MSEDQDLPARPALSGRRERARLLGEDGPPTWDGDGAGRAVPGDRPPAVPQEPLAPGQLPRRVPGSAPGGRTAPPGVRPAEPIRLPRPAGDVPSRGAFEPPPKSGEAAGPPDGEPAPVRPSGSARRLPDLKPASDLWSGAFQPTGGPDGRTGGRTGGRPAGRPASTVLAADLQPGVHPAAPSSPSRMTSPAAPPVPGPPVPGPARQADSTSTAGQAPFAGTARHTSPAPLAGPGPGSSLSGLMPPAAQAPNRAVSGDRTSAPAPSRFGSSPADGLRTGGPAGLTPARRPSAADSALIPASRRPAADSTLTPAAGAPLPIPRWARRRPSGLRSQPPHLGPAARQDPPARRPGLRVRAPARPAPGRRPGRPRPSRPGARCWPPLCGCGRSAGAVGGGPRWWPRWCWSWPPPG